MGESGDVVADNGSEVSALDSKIIRQMEYYFGDFNLSRDRFLQTELKKDDGWIPFDVLLTFNRLKEITTDKKQIVESLKKSGNELLEINEEETKVRRLCQKPLPENHGEYRDQLKERSVHVKGFPLSTTLDELMEFFYKYGKVVSIYMKKKMNSKNFKGSVYVTYDNKDEAEKFVGEEATKFKDKTVIKEMKEDYMKRKHDQYLKRQEEKQQRMEERAKNLAGGDTSKNEPLTEENITKGCILKMTGLSKDTTREVIKALLTPHSPVAFVDYSKGQTEGWVRFENEGGAALALEKASVEGKLIICDATIETSVLEGEEELAYWQALMKAKEAMGKRKGMKHNKPGGRQGKFSKGNRGRQRRDDRDGEGSSPKKAKMDDQNTKIKFEESDDDNDAEMPAPAAPSAEDSKNGTETEAKETGAVKREREETEGAEVEQEQVSKKVKTDVDAPEVASEKTSD